MFETSGWDESPVWGRMREIELPGAIFREVEIDFGSSTSLHFHDQTREINVCLSGRVTMIHGDSSEDLDEITLNVGDIFIAEPGMVHAARCPDEAGRLAELILNKPSDRDSTQLEPGFSVLQSQ